MFNFLVSLHSRMIGLRSLRREEGQTLVEYGLILVFVALLAIGGLMFLGGKISSFLTSVGEKL